jgi:hypothetical protein
MAKLKTRYRVIFWCVLFVFYALFAAFPVPKETVLSSKWLLSLDTSYPASAEEAKKQSGFFPFQLENRFGYVSPEGIFTIQREKKEYALLSPARWAEFSGESESIAIKNPFDETEFTIESPSGYPFFLDKKVFLMHREQNTISRLDDAGKPLWKYDFAAPLTCVDAASDILVAGLLDGTIEIIGGDGRRRDVSKPSGSRLAAIYGCAVSQNGGKIAVISGRDDQRFLLIELVGGIWRITYHEFLGDGFNRPVRVTFINGERFVAFEREGGVGVYDTARRVSVTAPVAGRILSIDSDGSGGLIFVLAAEKEERKKIIVLDNSARVLISAPFQSAGGFLDRRGNELYLGGGRVLAAFSIEVK